MSSIDRPLRLNIPPLCEMARSRLELDEGWGRILIRCDSAGRVNVTEICVYQKLAIIACSSRSNLQYLVTDTVSSQKTRA